jgi:MFS family permease
MSTSTVTDASKASLREDVRTISLVGLVHGISHFFHLLLPPLFPLLLHDFGFSYAELGLLVTTLFVVSGSGQAMAGFVVDRIGARPVLFAAMACFALSGLALGTDLALPGALLAGVIAQAGEGEETLLAELDLGEVGAGLTNLDTDGHYARPDVFELTVDTRAKDGVNWR